jgi:hypothetical protein
METSEHVVKIIYDLFDEDKDGRLEKTTFYLLFY